MTIVRIRNWILVALVMGDSKEGLHLRIALTFTRHFYFEGKAAKVYVANKGYDLQKIFSLSFNPNSFTIMIVS